MARGSPAPEQQARSPLTRDSDISIKILSDVIVKVAEGIQQARKHLSAQRTIFQVPKHICEGREELFRPLFVSIGPYARNDDGGHVKAELLGMEDVKMQFLHDLMTKTSHSFLTACLQMLEEQESAIRSRYYKSFDGMPSDVFIKMMLLDGIFIIQFFMKSKHGEDIYSTIGNASWNASMVVHDLLLLENQIPFFVLHALFDLVVTCSNMNENLVDGIFAWFKSRDEFSKMEEETIMKKDVGGIKHLLHLYYFWYTCAINEQHHSTSIIPGCTAKGIASYLIQLLTKLFSCKRPPEPTKPAGSSQSAPAQDSTASTAARSIQPATQLQVAGVNFKKKDTYKSFVDVTFNKHSGDLEIPPFTMDDMMTSKLANLVALEQSAKGEQNYVTSYAAFMDNIIDTSGDVEILRQEGILDNMLASNDDVAKFFNQLCKYAHLDTQNHHFAKLFKEVDKYSKTKCNVVCAFVKRNHFRNFFVTLGSVVGVLLLSSTLLQTFYTVFSYYRPPSAS